MEQGLCFPAISDIFSLLEKERNKIFREGDPKVEAFLSSMTAKNHLDDRFLLLIPAAYWEEPESKGETAKKMLMLATTENEKSEKKPNREALSLLHTGKKGKCSAIREQVAKDLCKEKREYLQMGRRQFEKIFPLEELSPHLPQNELLSIEDSLKRSIDEINEVFVRAGAKRQDIRPQARLITFICKSLLYLLHRKDYAFFFWLLFLCALFQDQIVLFKEEFPVTQYESIIEFLGKEMPETNPFRTGQVENLPEKLFLRVRKQMVASAKGEIYITGASLKDAFGRDGEHSIVKELQDGVQQERLTHIHIFVTDPITFDASNDCGDAIRDVTGMVDSVLDWLSALCEQNHVYLDIDFLPLLQIDHAVLTEEMMAFRSNKLWNRARDYKGAFLVYLADYYLEEPASEYKAHLEYLKLLQTHSTSIYPDIDIDPDVLSQTDLSAYKEHNRWREQLKSKNRQYTRLYKVYEQQIYSHVCSTWSANAGNIGDFTPSSSIQSKEELYNSQNLLDDTTQAVLLPYLKETEVLFNAAIRKHDSAGECHIFPSLDLGFPNNVQRLAGGFATGMLVTWQCGIDIVPIDATVNVCTSSVFHLENFRPALLKDKRTLTQTLNQVFSTASSEKGYSFSFCSGNHFLLIAQDRETEEFYLVLHSSANELKKSYMGLYPVENNWYAPHVKKIPVDDLRGYKSFYQNGKSWCPKEMDQVQDGRYFRYLKDEVATHFIRMAHNFQAYNEQIHKWLGRHLASRLGTPKGEQDFSSVFDPIIRHHYYMPTNSSIALGTFAEPVNKIVPLFSSPRKPVYLFQIGSDNWQVNLGGKKGRVCLVPHGWGQKIDQIRAIRPNMLKEELVLSLADGSVQKYPTLSSQSITYPGKQLREFEDGNDFLKKGANMIKGSIIKTLFPCYEYSIHTINQKNGMYNEDD